MKIWIGNMYQINTNNVGLLIHAKNVESSAHDQIKTIKNHPSFIKLIAIMPDVHAGAGCVIGFTGTFGTSIVPNIVGVDIGCGVLSYKLPPDIDLDLPALYDFIEKTIPTGFSRHEKTVPLPNKSFKNIIADCEKLVQDKKLKANPSFQAGTLGGGNHFIEVERSPTTGDTYISIHSGSRKFGLEVAKYHQNKAKALLKQMNISVPRDLEYLPLDMGGKEYMNDMYLAQQYAEVNRYLMLTHILKFLGIRFSQKAVIHSVHNYISSRDNVVRKGAISAHKYEPVVIPLSMGKDGGIVIGEGLGNENYNNSAPHGAGRLFGRKVMKRKLKAGELTMESFKESMEGVYSKSIVENTIDESPAAYKTMDSIEEFLKETVKIIDIARPILAFKDAK